MAIIQSGADSTLWTIDATSHAGRITIYDKNGVAMGSVSSLSNILNALNSSVTVVLGGQATLGLNVTGTTGTLTLSFEASMDNIAWFPISANSTAGTGLITSTSTDGYWIASTSGFYAIRARVSAYTSGSMSVSVVLTPGTSHNISQAVTGTLTANIGTTGGLALDTTLTGGAAKVLMYDGSNIIGTSAHPVRTDPTGSTTQPISGTITANAGTGSFTVAQATAANLNATVSGTVVSNIGTTNGLALDFSLTGGTQRTKITDGTNNAALSNSSPAGTEQALIVRNIPSGTQAISGTVAATQSGTFTVQPGNTANTTPWLTTLNQGGNSATISAGGALKIDGSATTQPVSGTITANAGTGTFAISASSLPLPTGAATETTLATRLADATFTGRINTLGQKTMAASTPVVLSSDQSTLAVSSSGNFTVVQSTASNLNANVSGTITANIGTSGSLALDASVVALQVAQASTTSGQKGSLIFASTTTSAPTYTTGQTNPLSLTTGGLLRVDGSGTTQPISGTIIANAGTGTFAISAASLPLPSGAATETTLGSRLADATFTTRINTLGQKTMSASTPVVLSSDQSAVSVAGTGSFTVAQSTAANLNATITGTVTSNIGTTNGLALDATLTGGSQTTRITDGTNTATVKAASTAAGATDKALVVAVSPNNSVAVTGTFFQGTQPVSGTVTANAGSGSFTVAQSTAANLNATVVGSGNFTVVQATASNLNANVSGTVTSNIGTTNGLALDATLTGGTSRSKITDGTNNAAVKAASTAPTATDPALVVAISPNSSIVANTDGYTTTVAPSYTNNTFQPLSLTTSGALRTDSSATTQPISGTVAATQSGTFTVQPGNTANTTPWLSTINQGGNSATVSAGGALKVDGSASTQPISGTITANIGTSGSLALDATLTGGTQRTKLTDGTNNSAVKAASTAAVATDPALVVAISPNNSVAVTGTFFQATQPVSGTVTANAGSGAFTVVQATASSLNATVIGTASDNTTNSTTKLPVMVALSNTASPTWTNGNMVPLSVDTSGALRITGTISSSNPSVTTTGSAPPGSATYIAGSVSTSAPTYTTGQMSGLSLTTSGALRTDSSSTTQPVSGSVVSSYTDVAPATQNITAQDIVSASNTFANGQVFITGAPTANSFTSFTVSSQGTGKIQVTGTWTGTLSVEQSMDGGTTWIATPVNQSGISYTTNNFTANFIGNLNTTGATNIRVRATAAWTGTATIKLIQSLNQNSINIASPIKLSDATTQSIQNTIKAASTAAIATDTAFVVGLHPSSPLPTGSNTIGTVTANAGTGTFTVSGTVTSNIGTTNGLALDTTVSALQVVQSSTTSGQKGGLILGAVTTAAPTYTTTQSNPISLTTSGAIRVDGSGSTQPISGTITANAGTGTFTVAGTVTANIGTTNGLALDVTLTGGSAKTKITDGTNTAAISNTAPAGTEQALIVRNIPSGTQTVSGTVAATQSGTFTVQPGNTANTTPWLATINQGGNAATVSAGGALKVDASASTQPVSGTITANAGTGTFAVSGTTTSNQGTANTAANGWFSRLTDGTNNVAVKAASTQAVAADPGLVVSLNPISAAPKSSTATVAQVASSATSVTLLAANANRLGAMIVNDSTQILFVKFGSGSSSTSYTTVIPISRGMFEVPYGYTGVISGNWNTAQGFAYCTELLA